MGWASGTEVIIDVWNLVREWIPEDKRVAVLAQVIDVFTNHDWDCLEEIEEEWPESKEALKIVYPDYEFQE